MQNQTLIEHGRSELKELLSMCTEPQQLMFKRMYCHNNLDATINEAVDQMDADKIDRAMTQVERTLAKK